MNLHRAAVLSIASLLAFVVCSRRPERPMVTSGQAAIVVRAEAPSGCVTQLVAHPSHPFLAEFTREVTITCADASVTLSLQRDPGGLGRVELVSLDGGDLAVTDAFQSAVVRSGATSIADDGLHDGKLDHYPTPCAQGQVFQRRRGTFLGAFDYCDHHWVFLSPSGKAIQR